MKGTKPKLREASKAIRRKKPPEWLSSFAREEWRRVMPELSQRRILTPADLGSLENYCIGIGRVRELEYLLRIGLKENKTIDPKVFRMQDKAIVTARQLAAELGLTPVSRSRPSVREDDSDADSLVD
ncbi:phage terminase small subunit P27 family [Bradyrhizobium sp. 33ap4]|uniref:phage terminase small subunit P27 family n=1 Tax=Bradyrhizobium sp. 33ap4 TaxID=3061630 RepID=UPI002930183E|nr:phage terminase small subunit P27 family [Bradyrhizobium sp. 33ap4]